MQMMLGDGCLLVQVISMLLYNQMNLKAMVFTMAPLLLFQNGKLCLDILNFVKEPREKTTFVRLIGQHDSIYLVIVFTGLVSLMNVLDTFAVHAIYAVNLIYVPMIMFLFVRIMDTKQARLANSFFPLVVVVFTAIALYVYLATTVVAYNDMEVA